MVFLFWYYGTTPNTVVVASHRFNRRTTRHRRRRILRRSGDGQHGGSETNPGRSSSSVRSSAPGVRAPGGEEWRGSTCEVSEVNPAGFWTGHWRWLFWGGDGHFFGSMTPKKQHNTTWKPLCWLGMDKSVSGVRIYEFCVSIVEIHGALRGGPSSPYWLIYCNRGDTSK